MAANVRGLAEVGELEAQIFNLVQMQIESQMHNLVLLPPFWQTLVVGSFIITAL